MEAALASQDNDAARAFAPFANRVARTRALLDRRRDLLDAEEADARAALQAALIERRRNERLLELAATAAQVEAARKDRLALDEAASQRSLTAKS
jgi:hypothetical protein